MSIFKNPSELVTKQTISVLVYGQPGVGKTTIGLSAPAPALLDFDGGVGRVNGAHQCPTLQVNNWDEVNVALDELANDGGRFQTIVVDTVGKMLDYMSADIIAHDPSKAKRDGSLSLQGYGVRKQMFVNFIKRCYMMGKNVVFIAHEREDKQNEVIKKRPEIGGSSAADLFKDLDLVGYVEMIGQNRTVHFVPQEYFYAKNGCNLKPAYLVEPLIGEDGRILKKNDFLSNIIEENYAFKAEQHKTTIAYENLIVEINALVGCVEDAKTANDVMDKILGMSHIWDSKTRGSYALSAKAKSLGLTFNKIESRYEAA